MKDKKITEEYLANTVNHIVDREGKEPTANALLEIFKEEGFSTSWRWIDKTLAKLNTAGLIKTHKGSSTSVMRVTLHDALDKVVDDAIDFSNKAAKADIKKVNDSHQVKVDELLKALSETESKLKQAAINRDSAIGELESANKELEQITALNAANERFVDRQNINLLTLEKENVYLKNLDSERLKQIEGLTATQSKLIDQAENTEKRHTATIELLEHKNKGLEDKLSIINGEVIALKEKISEHENSVAKLWAERDQAISDFDRKTQAHVETIETLSKEIESLHAGNEKITTHYESRFVNYESQIQSLIEQQKSLIEKIKFERKE